MCVMILRYTVRVTASICLSRSRGPLETIPCEKTRQNCLTDGQEDSCHEDEEVIDRGIS